MKNNSEEKSIKNLENLKELQLIIGGDIEVKTTSEELEYLLDGFVKVLKDKAYYRRDLLKDLFKKIFEE
ncbi:hypothetical protein P8907_19870 [Bacillus atrophaeus]|uniref:hypothetical protein n=1 Tax=Bacillus atrophaeus TaxID=1452 RepID=UPI00228129E6|nr:hypothetical protein [Bacillus atrophaeus]MCY8911059.1 hypothetical protein [Bacillus atrophaeus]MEC0836358.1 hypothetical protein [Bacillus atrophaeus]MEC0846592.1 hypothetical protein [Bacillus atrophaeus]MEC0850890.1 hypothetical protein [Bacillus atrophaeus]MEC0867636.1 hypothetical protein [Bacillus atrophaeus]